MIGTIVDYLQRARVPFRLASYPSEEAHPVAVHAPSRGALMVETRLFAINGRPVLTVFPAGQNVEIAAIAASLGGVVVTGVREDLPDELRRTEGSIPPFGQLFGLPIVVDERVTRGSILAFRAFSESAYFEIPYEDYARLEQPRLASFASAGELQIGTH